MVKDLIIIASSKLGSQRQLGIALGFPKKYAGQRVQKLIENPNITMNIFKKLLQKSELLDILEKSIECEKKKLNK